MVNCFNTKIKGAVDNDNVPKYGAFRVKITNYNPSVQLDHLYIRLPEGGSGVTCEVSGDGYISTTRNDADGSLINPVKKIENYGNAPLYFSAGTTFYIDIASKYAVAAIGGTAQGITLADIKHPQSIVLDTCIFMTELDTIQMANNNSYGDILALKNCPKLQTVDMDSNPNVVGDIAVFSDKMSLISIDLFDTNVYGDIANLASTPVTSVWLNRTKVSGTLESFCKEACKTRVSGSVNFNVDGTYVTFNNAGFNLMAVTFTATGCTLDNGWTYNKATDTWTAPA